MKNKINESIMSESVREDMKEKRIDHMTYMEDMEVLERLIYTSDKQSRNCFACKVQEECDWDVGKKNTVLEI